MNKDGGWLRLYRSILNDPKFEDEPYSPLKLWLWLMCKAAWNPDGPRAVGPVLVSLRGLP